MRFKVVVVDDDLLSLKRIKTLLEDQDMTVSCLRSGNDLLKFLEKNTTDIILLDILMPEMDGFETYSAVREFEEKNQKSQTPIIFLTGENDSDVERRGLKEGASDFVRKPLDKDILVKRIRNTVERNKKIEELIEEATLDKLTGFLNKAAGTKAISEECSKQEGALMLLDLDNFKLVNDLFGHDMGDNVLVALSDVIRHSVRAHDVVSRIGGDEFMIFFPSLLVEDAVASLTNRLNSQLTAEADALMGSDHGIPLGISVGVAFAPLHTNSYDKLFHYADTALYKTKNKGKHGYTVFEPMDLQNNGTGNLDQELSRVLQIFNERGERKGALIFGREAFSQNYRFIIRFLERYGGLITRLMISAEFDDSEMPLQEKIDSFSKTITKCLRSSDIIYQSRPNHFFIVLPFLYADDLQGVIDRLKRAAEGNPGLGKVKMEFAYSFIEMEKNSNLTNRK